MIGNQNKNRIKRLLCGMLLFAGTCLSASGQGIFVNTIVTPPYGSDVESYADKTRIIITASLADINNVECYLHIKIIGNNGIVLQSLPDREYPTFNLTNGAPIILTGHDLFDYFRLANLSVSGIGLHELQSQGLPEGDYQICARVFHLGNPWSDEAPSGCSNFFQISYVNPPTIISPVNQSVIDSKIMQNIIFNWIPSPGSPPWTSYQLKIFELRDSTQSPGDAVLSGIPFFETTILQTSFLYGPAQPLLEPGLRYAFQVKALDSETGQKYKNDGNSEVFWFKFNEPNIGVIQTTYTDDESPVLDNILEDFKKEFELIPSTQISGRIFSKFPDNTINYLLDGMPFENNEKITMPDQPIGSIDISKRYGPSVKNDSQKSLPENNTLPQEVKQFSYSDIVNVSDIVVSNAGNISINAGSGFSKTQISEKSEASLNNISTGTTNNSDFLTSIKKAPFYYFGNTEQIENVKPLANQRVKLVGRYAILPEGDLVGGVNFPKYGNVGEAGNYYKFYDLFEKNRTDVYKIADVVLAVTETDENGNFTFDFTSDFFTGHFYFDELTPPSLDKDMLMQNPRDKLGWVMENVFPGADNFNVNNIQAFDNSIAIQNNSAAGLNNNTVNENIQAPQQQKVMSGTNTNFLFDRGGYICLKIEVENPKFCSPDIDIFVMPGDNLAIPDQVAKVKTYDLIVRGIASDEDNQIAERNKPMDNVNVQVFRDYSDSQDEIEILRRYEGQKLNSKTTNNYGEFKDVAKGISGAAPNDLVYLKNLIKHAGFNPQYYVSLSVRDVTVSSSEYENTKYNYKSVFIPIPDNKITSATQRPEFMSGGNSYPGAFVTYNHLYKDSEIFELDCTLYPENPEIKGRVMAQTNIQNLGMSDVGVKLYKKDDPGGYYSLSSFMMQASLPVSSTSIEAEQSTNDVGIFRFQNLPIAIKNNYIHGPYRSIYISHPGYKRVLLPKPGFDLLNIKKGTLIDFKDINLERADSLKGLVKDEDGNPVVSYVKTEYSPFYKTYNKIFLGKQYEFFSIPFYDEDPKISVEPKSSAYFGCDTTLTQLPTKPLEIIVYKKLYRPEILVKNSKGEPITNAEVTINDIIVKTTSQGIARFKFASPGNQFVVKIIPPDDYSPIQQIIELEVTPGWKRHVFVVKNGKSISGHVTNKKTKFLVSGVKIFSELSYENGLRLYIETETDANGSYWLKGVPSDATSIKVHIVKPGNNPTYTGKTATVNFPQGQFYVNVNFEIEPLEGWDMADIWGYPVAIEKFELNITNPDRAKISGYFYNLPSVKGVEIQQPNLKIPFNNLDIKKLSNAKGVPLTDKIILTANSIPFIINGTFKGELKNMKKYGSNTILNKSLEINKEGDFAVIKGMAGLDLNSFNVSTSFNGSFFLGDNLQSNKTTMFSTNIASVQNAINSVMQQSTMQNASNNVKQATNIKNINTENTNTLNVTGANYSNNTISTAYAEFNVFSLDDNLQPIPFKNYMVYNFRASSILNEKSKLVNDKILIPTILHTDIPTSINSENLDLKINVGDIIVTNSEVTLNEMPYSDFSFDLEKWKLYGKDDWYFDKNEEAIVLKKVLVNTGVGLDVTLKNMHIGPNYIGETEVDIEGGINLGGIKKITLNPGLKPIFNYDNIGHYRISVVGSLSEGTPAGYISGLPEMKSSDRIEFNSIGILSNQTEALSINGAFTFFDIINVEVNRIVTGNGYFDLVGQPSTGIPAFFPTETTMRYKLDKGKIIGEMQFLDGQIDCPGNVTFSLDKNNTSQTFSTGKYTSYGTFTIAGGNGANSESFTLRGFLTKTKTSCDIKVIKVDNNKLYEGADFQKVVIGSNSVDVFEGLINTSDNNWGILSYNGYTQSINGLEDKNNVLEFKVNGAIDVSSSNVKVTNIDVGMGSMTMVYDINSGSMTGTLNINMLPLGYATIKQGLMKMCFDSHGYYFAVNSQLIIGVNDGWKGGFVIGNTNYINPTDLTQIKKAFKEGYLPPFFKGGSLTGFYTIGEKQLLDKSYDLIFVDASLKAGLGAFVNGDFGSDPEFLIGGYAYASLHGEAGLSKLCRVGVGIDVHGIVSGGYDNGSFSFSNCLSIAGKGWSDGYCTAPLKALGVPTSLRFSLKADCIYNNGFNFNISEGSCSGPSK
ncbi:MAG: hypothetical protein JW717_01140 [Marinilabiliaceae bacterium]|nr:hypothetical protein [Marinilabiliaceae bacterium]